MTVAGNLTIAATSSAPCLVTAVLSRTVASVVGANGAPQLGMFATRIGLPVSSYAGLAGGLASLVNGAPAGTPAATTVSFDLAASGWLLSAGATYSVTLTTLARGADAAQSVCAITLPAATEPSGGCGPNPAPGAAFNAMALAPSYALAVSSGAPDAPCAPVPPPATTGATPYAALLAEMHGLWVVYNSGVVAPSAPPRGVFPPTPSASPSTAGAGNLGAGAGPTTAGASNSPGFLPIVLGVAGAAVAVIAMMAIYIVRLRARPALAASIVQPEAEAPAGTPADWDAAPSSRHVAVSLAKGVIVRNPLAEAPQRVAVAFAPQPATSA
jgi:hypothetical protein